MTHNIDITEAVEATIHDIQEVLEDEAQRLRDTLQRTSPTDEFEFIRSWEPIKVVSKYFIRITNTADHASILARGRRKLEGRWYGSIQNGWGAGLIPFENEFLKSLIRRTDEIQH